MGLVGIFKSRFYFIFTSRNIKKKKQIVVFIKNLWYNKRATTIWRFL